MCIRDRVSATQYDRDVYGLGYGFSKGGHEFEVNIHKIKTEDTGTPSLPMDIDWFNTEVWNASYKTDLNGIGLEARVYGSEIDHGMSNSLLRPTPDFSSLMLPAFIGDDARSVVTDSKESGFKVALDWAVGNGTVITGIEVKEAKHNAAVYDLSLIHI